ncbi:MAG: GntR family transcriptional regulator [Alphaproteobacteria bacterium HGW-Alphaproteobacteria-2]|nr:MAG: GntR family transcriptional regulator [Alphaproteobacteria bacterium HGW-Alphaproteobacteria-2]
MNASGLPTHERIYRRLRDMVLYGDLAPGQAVTLHGLVAQTGVSTTPVREAIRRLTAAGALELRDNRRVAVPLPDAAALAELHNHAFHFTLYGAAQAQVLEPLAEALWLRFGPLGRVICGRLGTARMPDRHDETIAALRARNAEAAAAAIAADIDQGFTLMQAGVDGGGII